MAEMLVANLAEKLVANLGENSVANLAEKSVAMMDYYLEVKLGIQMDINFYSLYLPYISYKHLLIKPSLLINNKCLERAKARRLETL